MNIETLEIKLVKSSQIEDGDVIIVKMQEDEKNSLTKENVKNIYNQISDMLNNKDIKIFFFPKNLEIEILKKQIIDFYKNGMDLKIENNEDNSN